MHANRFAAVAGALALATVAACGSTGPKASGSPLGAPPPSFRGFPEQTHKGLVVADARFYTNYKEIFGDDLVDHGIVPIALRIGLKGERQDEVPVRPSLESMDLRMYLPDGTPLVPVLYTTVGSGKKVKEKIESLRFQEDLLTRWENAPEGFVFFQLPKDAKYDSDDYTVTHVVGGHARTVDLTKSVCAFSLIVEKEPEPFHTGIKKDRRAVSR